MTNSQYIAALEKALVGMDKKSRNDILLEIKSHAEDSGDNSSSLIEQFGSPEELAKQYLEGATVAAPISSRASFWGKRLLLSIGVATVFIITATALSVWYLSQDEFDYANEQAPQLKIDSGSWTVTEWSNPMTINVHQAEVVFYWHDKNQIAWKCGNSKSSKELIEDILTIRHNHCFVFLPLQMSSIKVNQGSVVLVRPQANIRLNFIREGFALLKMALNITINIMETRTYLTTFNPTRSQTS